MRFVRTINLSLLQKTMEQLNLFDFTKEEIKVEKPIRLIELFGGYGSQALALERIGADFQTYKLVEFDKYAVKSYNAIHNTDFKPTDITKVHGNDLNIIDTDKYCYMVTYSFPCQDLSLAGNQNGMSKGSGTRSGLLWEVERLLKEIVENNGELPQILFMENVKQIISKKNMPDFKQWCNFLESIGYTNTYKVLNAKDYGVPQNRERCFMFSFLVSYNYHFPEPIPLTHKVKDLLEDDVDEKYYIKTDNAKRMLEQLIADGKLKETSVWDKSDNEPKERSVSNALLSREDRGISHHKQEGTAVIEKAEINQLGNMVSTGNFSNPQVGRVYDSNGLMPTLNTCSGGGHEPKIVEQIPCKIKKCENGKFLKCNECKIHKLDDCIGSTLKAVYYKGIFSEDSNAVICAMRGRNPDNPSDRTARNPTEQRLEPNTQGTSNALTTVQKDNLVLENVIIGGMQKNQSIKKDGISTCLTSSMGTGGGYVPMIFEPSELLKGAVYHNGYWYRIRKLTPKECGRLMDVSDDCIDKMAEVNSNAQLYKQFGNSIVVNCMVAMFSNLHIQGLPTWEESINGD